LNSWFLVISLVEIDGLSTFGHSVERHLLSVHGPGRMFTTPIKKEGKWRKGRVKMLVSGGYCTQPYELMWGERVLEDVCGAESYIGCPYPCPCPCPPVPMGFGWAWVGICFVHPCIQLQIGVKLLGCREYTNQEALRAEASDNKQPTLHNF
jgi:hypothetical protein